MMKVFLKISLVFLFGLCSVALMADPPDPEGGGGDPGGPPVGGGAPIGSGVFILTISATLYLNRKMMVSYIEEE